MKNKKATLSAIFQNAKVSSLRQAQQLYRARTDGVLAVDASIGNVRLPMHPAMIGRLNSLGKNKQFASGVVCYPPSVGTEEANKALINLIAASGAQTKNLHSMITSGGSQAMDYSILGTCSSQKPLLIFEPIYPNYKIISQSLSIGVVCMMRTLKDNGKFSECDITLLEKIIKKENPGAIVVIPYDNPTGDMLSFDNLVEIAKLCVKHNIWLISDEAYRNIYYTKDRPTGIWLLTEDLVPGITGRRISIETVSKGLNGCGLRIGGLVSDNEQFCNSALSIAMAHICTNAIGQYIFGAIANESSEDLNRWYSDLRNYYKKQIQWVREKTLELIPEVIFSKVCSAIYSVVDLRNIVPHSFDSNDFVSYCAKSGSVPVGSKKMTLLTSPMSGFYATENEFARTQIRISYVEDAENIKLIPQLLSRLLKDYLATKC